MPQGLQSSGGDLEGTIDLQWEPVRGRYNYFLECAQDANGPWTNASFCFAGIAGESILVKLDQLGAFYAALPKVRYDHGDVVVHVR